MSEDQLYGAESVGLHIALMNIRDLEAERDRLKAQIESMELSTPTREWIIDRDHWRTLAMKAKEALSKLIDENGDIEVVKKVLALFDEADKVYCKPSTINDGKEQK